MCMQRFAASTALLSLLTFVTMSAGVVSPVRAQSPPSEPVHFRVDSSSQRLEMIVNTSRILTLDSKIPEMLVNNPEVLRATPLAPNQVQVSALRPGVTQLNLWDDNKKVYSIDVVVYGDARELENLLASAFPEATLHVRPLATSAIISGYVPTADMVTRAVSMAEDYYPKVINAITVGGAQQILLHVKVLELSRTKMRKQGIDWLNVNLSDPTQFAVQRTSGLITDFLTEDDLIVRSGSETHVAGIVNNGTGFFALIEALRQYNLAKVLAEPTLVTISGRPASFNSGGEIPIPVPSGLGTVSIEYRQFGTRIDFVPIVLGNGSIRLEVRPQISDVDPARTVSLNNISVPGFRTRWVDTAVEMKAGQTLALAGLIQTRLETENRGVPWLSDLPWVGAAFRRVEETQNEVELLIMVTPEFVDAMDPCEVPKCGPGELTQSPSDVDLYWRGYMEVPKCCADGSCSSCQGLPPVRELPVYEEVDPGIRYPQSLEQPSESLAPPAEEILLDPPQPQAFRRDPGTAPVTQPASSRRPVTARPAPRPAAPVTEPSQPALIGPIGYDTLK